MLKRTTEGHAQSTKKAHAHGLARVAGLLACVWITAMIAGVSMVRAEADETLLGLGSDLMRYENARSDSPSHALSLNGARIQLASGMSDDPVIDVLDEFERRCRAHDGGLGPQAREVARENGGELPSSLVDGTIRESDERRGFVACLDTRVSLLSAEEAIAAIERFVVTHDIAELGDIRYAYAERTEEGTHFVTIASDGAIDLDVMFPGVGDVPGVDVPGVPRPVGARRILSAWEENEPYGMTLYADAQGDPRTLASRTRSGLVTAGFTLIELADEAAFASDGTESIVAENAERMVIVSLARDSEGTSLVSVLAIEHEGTR